MPEAQFTKEIKEALADELRYVCSVPDDDFDIRVDRSRGMPSYAVHWRGRPDIWIAHRRYPRILVVEIEHLSGDHQAMKNVIYAANWTDEVPRAYVSFLHVVSVASNLRSDVLARLKSLEGDDRGGLLYRLFAYDPATCIDGKDAADRLLRDGRFQAELRTLWNWVCHPS